MLRGLYSAASGLIAQQRRHDTVTNNIANLNTPGFKQSDAVTRSFPEMLLAMSRVNDTQRTEIGRWNSGVFAEEAVISYRQGDLMQTNQPSDFAIVSHIAVPGLAFDESGKSVAEDGQVTYQPQAFFTLETADGERAYTRGGRFLVSADGFLTSAGGHRVLGVNNEPIQLAPNVSISDWTLADNRRFIDANGVDTGVELLVSRIDNPHELVRSGEGLFRLTDGAAAVQPIAGADNVQVMQGYMERSNVDAAQSSVDLMAALRAYEANQKVVQFYDQSLQKAVNEVGRV
ncbi:flagellar hook-basal body protein [Paenibacillus yanchengensis]|uniref:Flagellar hook-basal body protein n=1 Tax=Paenibacillus yanchengensis TaxID=2035833 RepID=A0ABW4YMY2_9BACL